MTGAPKLGLKEACERQIAILGGINCMDGQLTSKVVADAHGVKWEAVKMQARWLFPDRWPDGEWAASPKQCGGQRVFMKGPWLPERGRPARWGRPKFQRIAPLPTAVDLTRPKRA